MTEERLKSVTDTSEKEHHIAQEAQQEKDSKNDLEYLKLEIEVWKKTIDVQQHFNDIEMRIRNLAVTILGAVITAAALTANNKQLLVAAGIVFAGIITWLAFYFMDQYWYHKLLRGAVRNSQDIEDRLGSRISSLKLTTNISDYSRFKLLNIKTSSTLRLHIFYITVAIVLLISLAALLIASSSSAQTPTVIPTPTLIPTLTPIPTPTLVPTLTPIPTPTLIPTLTLIATP